MQWYDNIHGGAGRLGRGEERTGLTEQGSKIWEFILPDWPSKGKDSYHTKDDNKVKVNPSNFQELLRLGMGIGIITIVMPILKPKNTSRGFLSTDSG